MGSESEYETRLTLMLAAFCLCVARLARLLTSFYTRALNYVTRESRPRAQTFLGSLPTKQERTDNWRSARTKPVIHTAADFQMRGCAPNVRHWKDETSPPDHIAFRSDVLA